MKINKVKLYKSDENDIYNKYAVDSMGVVIYKNSNEIDIKNDNNEIVVHHIDKITITFSNEKVIDLKQVISCDYDTSEYINICNSVFNIDIHNAYADGLTIKKLDIQGKYVNILDCTEFNIFNTVFEDLKIKYIRSGFSTESNMFITLEPIEE